MSNFSEVLSDEEDVLHNGVGASSGEHMLDSTYDMSVSTENDAHPRDGVNSTIPTSPRMENNSQPSVSSRLHKNLFSQKYL